MSKIYFKYSSILEDTQFFEKIKKENNEKKNEASYKFCYEIQSNLDDYYEKKVGLFEKILSSNSASRLKFNKLGNNVHNNRLPYQ